jgi:hypothetical protein
MNAALTLSDLATFGTIIAAVLGLWWRIEQMTGHVRDDLASYKLTVASDYARNGYIRDVDERWGKRFADLTGEIHAMRESIERLMNLMIDDKRAKS